MGLIAATIAKQSMIAYKHDLEYKMMLITQAKMGLSDSTKDLMNVGTDMDPDNPVVKQLEQRKERLNALEKKLDMELAEYKTRLEMAEANLKMAGEMEKSAIESMKG